MIGLLAALAAATSQPGTAQAPSVQTDAACIAGRLPATARAGIAAESLTGQAGPVRDQFTVAARACAEANRWSEDRSSRALFVSAATMLVEVHGATLEQRGIRVALLDAWVDRHAGAQLNEELLTALVRDLTRQGVTEAAIEANIEPLGAYIASRMALRSAQ